MNTILVFVIEPKQRAGTDGRRESLKIGWCVDGTGTDRFQKRWCGYGLIEREVRNLHFLAYYIFKKRGTAYAMCLTICHFAITVT